MSNTTVINLTAQITALSTALRIVLDASPNAAQAREQLTASGIGTAVVKIKPKEPKPAPAPQ